jgi:ABC-2 type transport system ATP-binding protein
MLVRLAFSVMLQADADVLLIDEVLAVGDAAFQQKCADAFHQMKREGKTIVLVTHDMSAVEQYCHRALLLADGEVQYIGSPALTGNEYLKLNFEGDGGGGTGAEDDHADGAKLLEARLVDDDGEEIFTIEERQQIRFHLSFELLRETAAVHLRFVIANSDDFGLFEFGTLLTKEAGDDLTPGRRQTVEVSVENRLAAGRHFLNCGIHSPDGVNLYRPKATTFVVFGAKDTRGIMAADYEITVVPEEER